MRPKSTIVQRELSPKAAHVGNGDPAKSKLGNGHLPGNNLIPRGIRRIDGGVEREYYDKYLGGKSKCRGKE